MLTQSRSRERNRNGIARETRILSPGALLVRLKRKKQESQHLLSPAFGGVCGINMAPFPGNCLVYPDSKLYIKWINDVWKPEGCTLIQSVPDAVNILGSRTNMATIFEKIQLVFSSLMCSTRMDRVKGNFPEITLQEREIRTKIIIKPKRNGRKFEEETKGGGKEETGCVNGMVVGYLAHICWFRNSVRGCGGGT